MKNTLTIGNTNIPYQTRVSLTAKRLTFHVTPEAVELCVPKGTSASAITTFIQAKQEWLFHAVRDMGAAKEKQETLSTKEYKTGAKILYRGRMTKLTLLVKETPTISVSYKNGFIITVPKKLAKNGEAIQVAIEAWMKKRLENDVRVIVEKYTKLTGMKPTGFKVKALKQMWGNLTKGNVINVNLQLAHAPKTVLEYVVCHEFCHLKYRNHSKSFWYFLENLMNDYEIRKMWLENKCKF